MAKLKRRERNVLMECTECKRRNYATPFKLRGGARLELSKYCKWCRKHTPHRGRRMDSETMSVAGVQLSATASLPRFGALMLTAESGSLCKAGQ